MSSGWSVSLEIRLPLLLIFLANGKQPFILISFLVKSFSFFVFTQYISLLMDWVESQINNEDIFPIDRGTATLMFPAPYSMIKSLKEASMA